MAWEEVTPAGRSGPEITVRPKPEDNPPPPVAESAKVEPKSSWKEVPMGTDAYDEIIQRMAKKYNVDPLMIKAMIRQESNGNPHAVSKAGAQGLMQLMPGTAKDMGVEDPFDPEQNIEGGTKYLAWLLAKNKGDVGNSLLQYGAGFDQSKYGKNSFAYPGMVLGHYRALGGRQMDWALPKAGALDIAANAATFGLAPEVLRLIGPDMPEALRRSIANERDANPWTTGAIEVGAQLPVALAAGGLLNRGLAGLPGRAADAGRFLAGHEAGGLGARATSAAVNAGMQGAALGAANTGTLPAAERDPLAAAGQGAVLGGAIGAGTSVAGAALGRAVLGPRINPQIARAADEAVRPPPGTPRVDLHYDPNAPNKFVSNAEQGTRAANSVYGGRGPLMRDTDVARESGRIGSMFDRAADFGLMHVSSPMIQRIEDMLLNRPGVAANNATFNRILNQLRLIEQQGVQPQGRPPLGPGLAYGQEYQALTQKGSALANLLRSGDRETREAARFIKEQLDDALLRGVRAKGVAHQTAMAQAHARGDVAAREYHRQAAKQALTHIDDLNAAKGQWRDFMSVLDSSDHTTGTVNGKALVGEVEKKTRDPRSGGALGRVARTLDLFPSEIPHGSKRSLYASMLAAGFTEGAVIHGLQTDPWKFIATMALGVPTGFALHGGWKSLQKIPAFRDAVIRRALDPSAGPLQQGTTTAVNVLGAHPSATSGLLQRRRPELVE